ncbi:hypothetical protein [Treponema primitia]|nr:hypothetical protein [Treponema primitia]
MSKDKIKVLLIEDHPLTRRGLASCLTDTGRCSIVCRPLIR